MDDLRIFLSVGEPSGDEHAAELVESLAELLPGCSFAGMGGSQMRRAGVRTVVDSESSASVMGFQEVVFALPRILRALSRLKEEILRWKPQIVVLVDYPDFNFRLASFAKQHGCKVFYFIPPQLWAWRAGRIEAIRKLVDQAAIIYPFESEFYRSQGYSEAVYVGNPAVERIKALRLDEQQRLEYRQSLNVNPAKPILALLPGSRPGELVRHSQLMIDAFKLAQLQHPEIQGIVPAVKSLPSHYFEPFQAQGISVLDGDALRLMQVADAGLLKSGTSNLQAALCNLPFAMLYKAPATTALIARALVPVRTFSIVNYIVPDAINEYVQGKARAESLASECLKLLFDQNYRELRKENCLKVQAAMDSFEPRPEFADCHSAIERTAQLIRTMALSLGR